MAIIPTIARTIAMAMTARSALLVLDLVTGTLDTCPRIVAK